MSVENAGGPAPEVLQVRPPEARRGTLKALGGSSDDDFNDVLANQVVPRSLVEVRAKLRSRPAGGGG